MSAPVLCLCDTTPASENAAWRAALVARELGVPLRLLHADRDPQRARSGGERLTVLARRIGEHIGIDVGLEVVNGDALGEATRASRDARLLVIGARRINALREWVLGTQAERLIRLSRAPVLVVKRDAHAGYRRLLVPLDFGPGAPAALALASMLSRAPRLEVFHALESRDDASVRTAGVTDVALVAHRRSVLHFARRRLIQLAEAVGGAARAAIPGVAFGPAAEAVVARAHAMRADVVVMGKRPRGAIAEFLLGSVTQRVLAQVRTDVLVVPEGTPALRPSLGVDAAALAGSR